MRVGAGDPGLKPGYVELDSAGLVVKASHRLEAWVTGTPWDVFATELQWHHGGKAPIQAILTLAFRAGFTLACIPAERSLALPPKVWRAFIGGPSLTKEQVQKRIATSLTPQERQLFSSIPKARHGDVLDAIGIARAARALATTTRKWDWVLK